MRLPGVHLHLAVGLATHSQLSLGWLPPQPAAKFPGLSQPPSRMQTWGAHVGYCCVGVAHLWGCDEVFCSVMSGSGSPWRLGRPENMQKQASVRAAQADLLDSP